MRDSKNVVIPSILAFLLVLVIVVGVGVNPIMGAVLGPLLLGVAAIVRAVTGGKDKDTNSDEAAPSGLVGTKNLSETEKSTDTSHLLEAQTTPADTA